MLKQVLHVQSGTGSKYLEHNPGSELNIFLWTMNNEKQKKIEWKQKSNKGWTKVKQQQKKTSNNDKTIHNITGTWALCTT